MGEVKLLTDTGADIGGGAFLSYLTVQQTVLITALLWLCI